MASTAAEVTTRALVVSRSPRVVRVAQARLGCVDMSAPGLERVGSEHGAIRRSQQGSIT